MTNCPNCGAVITGPKCEYCGTVFERQADVNRYRIENACIKQRIIAEDLYMKALAAMRAYENGLLTPNEVRKLI